jgi:hypothetical protein
MALGLQNVKKMNEATVGYQRLAQKAAYEHKDKIETLNEKVRCDASSYCATTM